MTRRLLAAAAVAILATACAGGSGAGPAASVAPASASPSGRPAANASPTAAPTAASCRLPVASGDAPSDGNSAHGTAGHGGFITVPGGAFSIDSASLATYDLAAARWLPVGRAWVAPDGRRYAYPEYRSGSGPVTGIIHVVDVAGGADHPLTVPAPSAPISWENAGIYLARVVPNSDAPPQGLSLLDPASGQLRQISADGRWTAIGTGAAYGTDLDSSIAGPSGPGLGAANRLRKLDLATGTASTVQPYPGLNVQILGMHGDTPILMTIDGAGQETVADGSARLYQGPSSGNAPAAPVVVDGSTVWLSGGGAVWRSAGGAPAVAISAPTLQFAVAAGACR